MGYVQGGFVCVYLKEKQFRFFRVVEKACFCLLFGIGPCFSFLLSLFSSFLVFISLLFRRVRLKKQVPKLSTE